MRASIMADSGRGPGNGIIEIFDAGSVNDPGFTLLRASDGKCLGPRGWQESETLLTPDAWDNDGGSLRLAVGPAVVDEVDNLDAYRISLRGVGSCALAVKSLVYSHIAGGHGMGAATPVAPAPQPAPVAPQPEPEPVLESPEPPLAFEEPQPAPQLEDPLVMNSQQPEKSGSKTWLIVLIVLALLAAGAAAWWFLLREPEKAPLPTPPAQEQNAEKPQTPEPEKPKPADNAPQKDAEAAKPALSPLASAREQLRGQALPDVSLGMAKPLRKADATPEETDAAFLLLEDAAQKGDAEAMFLVGQFYDPASTLPRGSIPADLTQAKRWYDQAAQKAQPQAKAALDKLKEYARGLEAKSDAEARALLQNWQ